jgi:hypothetical protein
MFGSKSPNAGRKPVSIKGGGLRPPPTKGAGRGEAGSRPVFGILLPSMSRLHLQKNSFPKQPFGDLTMFVMAGACPNAMTRMQALMYCQLPPSIGFLLTFFLGMFVPTLTPVFLRFGTALINCGRIIIEIAVDFVANGCI